MKLAFAEMTFKLLFLGSFDLVSVLIYARHGVAHNPSIIKSNVLSTCYIVDFVEKKKVLHGNVLWSENQIL